MGTTVEYFLCPWCGASVDIDHVLILSQMAGRGRTFCAVWPPSQVQVPVMRGGRGWIQKSGQCVSLGIGQCLLGVRRCQSPLAAFKKSK